MHVVVRELVVLVILAAFVERLGTLVTATFVLYRLNLVIWLYALHFFLLALLLRVVIVVRVVDDILEQLCPHLFLVFADLRAVLDEVLLVADECDLNMLVRVLPDFLEPLFEIVEGLLVGYVIDQEGAHGEAVVDRRDA